MCSHPLIVWRSPEVVIDPQVCQTSPQYVDPNTGEASPHCSQACREAEAASQQAQYSHQQQQQQGILPFTSGLPSTRLMHLPATATCSYPGCTLPATMYQNGSVWDYCSPSHQQYANVLILFREPTDLLVAQLRPEGLHLLSPG